MVTPNDVDKEESTQPTEEVSNETSPAKYLVLANAILWKDPDSDFMLTWTDQTVVHTLRDPAYGTDVKQPKVKIKDGKWWIYTNDIPEDTRLYTLINRAVRAGILAFVDSPEKWLKKERNTKAKQKGRVGLIWSELDRQDVKDNKIMPRSPSIAYNTMTYQDKDSKAYKILQEATQELRKLLPKVVGALSNAQVKETFLKEALYIERNGYNRAAVPRGAVIDMIIEMMRDHGIASGIGIVTEEQEPLTKDVKTLQIPI